MLKTIKVNCFHSKIYVVGGFNGQDVMCSAEVFDTSTNQWSYIKRMMTPRSGVSLVAHKNTLYAIGGFNGYNRLKTVEKLVLGSENGLDGWSKIAEMSTPRSNFATAILDDFIYVIGGFNGMYCLIEINCLTHRSQFLFSF